MLQHAYYYHALLSYAQNNFAEDNSIIIEFQTSEKSRWLNNKSTPEILLVQE